MNRINRELKPMYDKVIKLRNLSRIITFLREIETLKNSYIDLEMKGFIEYLKLIDEYQEIRFGEDFFKDVGFITDEENHILKLVAGNNNKESGYSKIKK